MLSHVVCVQTGELLWEVPEYDQRCMLFHGDSLFIGNGDGTVMKLNRLTGQEKYVSKFVFILIVVFCYCVLRFEVTNDRLRSRLLLTV